ncbi:MAG: hypothetical protein C4B56_04275 [Candidatus Methanophagaceae archaeon]|nr:MAG: hypothetical protein C4B56_04275 [Methanophagales archaeon]
MSNKDIGEIKSPLDSLFKKKNGKRMKGRKIEEIGVSSRGMYIRIADIIPNGSDICSNADIPELGDIGLKTKEMI